MKETGAVPPSGGLPTDGFEMAHSQSKVGSVLSFAVCNRKTKPLLYLELLPKSMLCVLDSSLKELYSLDDLFPGAYLRSMSYMFGDLAAVGSHDGRVFVVDIIARKVLHEFKAHAYSVLALHATGSRIASVGRDIFLRVRLVVLEFREYPNVGTALETEASIKMPRVPSGIELVTFLGRPSVLATFKASKDAHIYDVDYENLQVTRPLYVQEASRHGFHPVGTCLSHNGKRYAVVSRKQGELALTIDDIGHTDPWGIIISGNTANWASGVKVVWSSLEDRVYFTCRDGYVYTTDVSNAAELLKDMGTPKPPVKMSFKPHHGGVKFVEAFDHDILEMIVTVGNDDAVYVWSRPITRPIAQPRV